MRLAAIAATGGVRKNDIRSVAVMAGAIRRRTCRDRAAGQARLPRRRFRVRLRSAMMRS